MVIQGAKAKANYRASGSGCDCGGVCEKIMVLKIRLETDEWIYEEHENA